MHKASSGLAGSLLLLAPFAWPQATETPVIRRGPSVAAGKHGVVVSGKPAATAAGINIRGQGGNAADAGAATLLALSVTSSPKGGDEFRINLFRSQGPPSQRVQIAWRPTMRKTFHVPERFGVLRLKDSPGQPINSSRMRSRRVLKCGGAISSRPGPL